MNRYESYKVKQIDRRILAELIKGLEIREDNVNIIQGEEMEKIFQKINEKKRIIFLLFKGNFSHNQRSISDRMKSHKKPSTIYDDITNTVVSKRVEKVFKKIANLHTQDNRTICVCMDREIFIKRILSENVQEDFVKKYIKEIEPEIYDQKEIDRDE